MGIFNTLPVLGQHGSIQVQMQCLYNRILSKQNTTHPEIICVTTNKLILTDVLNDQKS